MSKNSEPSQETLRSATGRVAETLKMRLTEMIWSGEFVEGDRLPPERELMQSFGVSRSVVREAINDLSSRGLLFTRPGFRPIISRPNYDSALSSMGMVVSKLIVNDPSGMRNLFDTRIFLESALARKAAISARREDVQKLEAALLENRESIGNRGQFEMTDLAFHHVLYEISRNPIFPVVHRAYVAWLYDHWRQIDTTEEIDRMIFSGHEAIFLAIVDRDPDEAERAVERHLTMSWEHVRSTFNFRADVR